MWNTFIEGGLHTIASMYMQIVLKRVCTCSLRISNRPISASKNKRLNNTTHKQ